jgi:hypothetical protein
MWWVGEGAWRVLGLRTVPLHHKRHDTLHTAFAAPPSTDCSHVMAYGALLAALGRDIPLVPKSWLRLLSPETLQPLGSVRSLVEG